MTSGQTSASASTITNHTLDVPFHPINNITAWPDRVYSKPNMKIEMVP